MHIHRHTHTYTHERYVCVVCFIIVGMKRLLFEFNLANSNYLKSSF